ncbi:MAG: helix-turn-helix transcriptional regulator, partial [Anaerolineae bacterium]
MLRELTRRNLFITPLDGDRQWFRYHHLLAQFLRSRLLRQYSAEEVAHMHLRAGRWFADAGFIEEGIQHMIAAGEVEEAVG